MNIVNDIEKIIKIEKYNGEKTIEYKSRLYYNALRYWIEDLIFKYNIKSLSKKDIINILDRVSIHLYRALDINIEWLKVEEIPLFIKEIVDNSMIDDRIVTYNNFIFFRDNYNDSNLIFNLKNELILDVASINNKYSNNFRFNEIIKFKNKSVRELMHLEIPKELISHSVKGKVEIFIPNDTGIFRKSWINKETVKLSNNRYLVKNFNKYYLYDVGKDIYYEINDYYIQDKEIYRLQYYIYYCSNKNVRIKFEFRKNYFIVEFDNELPYIEESIIKNISFPINRHDDFSKVLINETNKWKMNNLLKNLGITFLY